MPSFGHFSSATRRVSWTISSATSKFPMIRTRRAVRRPASSRKTWTSASSAWAVVDRRPDLNRALARPALGERDRFVEVGHLDLGVAADDFLGLDEGTIGHYRLAVCEADRGGRRDALELLPAHDLRPVGLEPLHDPAVNLGAGRGIVLAAREHQHVLHRGKSPQQTAAPNVRLHPSDEWVAPDCDIDYVWFGPTGTESEDGASLKIVRSAWAAPSNAADS